jgi:hypothetical protein
VTWTFAHVGSSGSPEIDRVFVFWSPEACIADSMPDDGLSKVVSGNTQDNFFVIYDLRYDCRYLVRVQSVTNQGIPGATAHLTLLTPSCQDVTVVGRVRPECPNNVPRIPDEPFDLQHSFLISSSNITARLNWGIPATSDPASITGYRVVWGQMLQTHSSIMDKTTALTKVLAKDTRTLNIGNLLEGMTYLVRVQALSKAGAGRISTVQFTTPLLQLAPIDIPFRGADDSGGHHDDDDEDEDDYVHRPVDGSNVVVVSTLRSANDWQVSVTRSHQQVAPRANDGCRSVVWTASNYLRTWWLRVGGCVVVLLLTSLFDNRGN